MGNRVKNHKRIKTLWILIGLLVVAGGCMTSRPLIKASKQVERDFYACKGFNKGVPVDATSEFLVEEPGLIYIVADLEKEMVDCTLDFEVTAPTGRITYAESVRCEQDRPYGYYFDKYKLYERGGSGQWKVLFWADGRPVGRLFFNLIGPEGEGEMAATGDKSIFETLFGEDAQPIWTPGELPESATAEEEIILVPTGDAVEEVAPPEAPPVSEDKESEKTEQDVSPPKATK